MPASKYVVLLSIFLATHVFAVDSLPTEESIKQLLAITESRKLVDGMMNQMNGMMNDSLQQVLQGQPVTPKQQKILDNMQSKVITLLKQEYNWDYLEPLYIRIYRESFTQEEINGMLAFYKTPTGRALIKKMPVVMQKSMTEMQKRMVPLMEKLHKIQQEALGELKNQSAK